MIVSLMIARSLEHPKSLNSLVSGAIRVPSDSKKKCISYNECLELALAACSFREGCPLKLAQQLTMTYVCIGERSRLRPLDRMCPRRVLCKMFSPEIAKKSNSLCAGLTICTEP